MSTDFTCPTCNGSGYVECGPEVGSGLDGNGNRWFAAIPFIPKEPCRRCYGAGFLISRAAAGLTQPPEKARKP